MTRGFRDLAVAAYEKALEQSIETRERMVVKAFEDTFGVKPAETNVMELMASIGSYRFRLSRTYEGGEWFLTIKCPKCSEICECGRVTTLENVGCKIKSWEESHKCKTGEGL